MALNEFAKKWVEALRSGKYKQGMGRLYNEEEKSYCCLGVAEAELGSDPEALKRCYISAETQKLLGLTDNAGSFARGGRTESLAFLNDSKEYTFTEIASLIEMQPEGLFRISDPPATL